ncbi:ATP-dependent RecD-like DNA helicase [Suipraeoptans intestinalis]|uniref:SF1B family DNA helicase RecD2 n=1 Tax=Suipraeoptans intestinalis TaxID=2606628 RepID=UPI0023EFA9CF|nr:ATP-dependent RecD-like DNA helicase [Suipraeoptans intestinalis]MDD7770220.1 ATP-dependent RecD-like DNA helicase [Suipraeoptans intestinalis]MDY3122720.1 ATP-dependent RecD-like DNA helicase [Suipraeoptans intestinalis]
METIKGYVDHIVYRNEANGYTVFQLEQKEEQLTCVGELSYLEEGELVELDGHFTVHKMYGSQFQVETSRVCSPTDTLSIEKYLGSGAIRGLREAMARKIVEAFGEETFRIIEEEPERLAEIKGISERKAREIAEQLEEKREMRQSMLYMQKYGISPKLAAKIFQYYGNRVYRILEENPYQMADKVEGVGFKTVDEIAMRAGIHVDSDYRIRCGMVYVLLQGVGEGHIYLREEVLLYRTEQILGVVIEQPGLHLQELSVEKKIVVKNVGDETRVYASAYYQMEWNVAGMLKALDIRFEITEEVLRQRLEEVEVCEDMKLDQMQWEAVRQAVRKGVLVLTGGPGTGKTTTINAMIHFFRREGLDICLAAPTGRAAKRMTEATGYEAQTIHRLLEINGDPEKGARGFQRNEEQPLETDVVIVDEMSMVDLPLMSALLKAMVTGTRLILVGDCDQLPSVGPGSVLKDIVDSGCYAVVKLTQIFRQMMESDIIVNAHKINQGLPVHLDNKSKDFFFLKRMEPELVMRVILALVQEKLPAYVQAKPFDIQVLTPTRKGVLGVEKLNEMLQKYLNPPSEKKKEKLQGDRIFREGDKVMQIKNNYQMPWEIRTSKGMAVDKGEGIFNGDMGIIKEIPVYGDEIVIEFEDGKLVRYSYELLDELELAYAITIHKSQGSEYPAVVIPLLNGPRQLYHRNLLYTAVTRARRCVTLVGSEVVFDQMVQNGNEQRRNTSLTERIRELEEWKTGV